MAYVYESAVGDSLMSFTYLFRLIAPWKYKILRKNGHCSNWLDVVVVCTLAIQTNDPGLNPVENKPSSQQEVNRNSFSWKMEMNTELLKTLIYLLYNP